MSISLQEILAERKKIKKEVEELKILGNIEAHILQKGSLEDFKDNEKDDLSYLGKIIKVGQEDFLNEELKLLTDNEPDEPEIPLINKNYGDCIFECWCNYTKDKLLEQFDENERYIFENLLALRFFSKVQTYFNEKPFSISKLIFELMTVCSESSNMCQQYLINSTDSWLPSYGDILATFFRWGASYSCLEISEEEYKYICSGRNKMEFDDNSNTNQSIIKKCEGNCFISKEKVEVICTTFEYFQFCLPKLKLKSDELMVLIASFLKISLDRNLMEILPSLSSIIDTLLDDFSDKSLIKQLGDRILQFRTEIVNKSFICFNVLPKSCKAAQLSVYFSFHLIENILQIDTRTDFIEDLEPIIDIIHCHDEKIRSLSPENIYFITLLLTNIIYRLGISRLEMDLFICFVNFLNSIKKLPQLNQKVSNIKMVRDFIEWCSSLLQICLDEKRMTHLLSTP